MKAGWAAAAPEVGNEMRPSDGDGWAASDTAAATTVNERRRARRARRTATEKSYPGPENPQRSAFLASSAVLRESSSSQNVKRNITCVRRMNPDCVEIWPNVELPVVTCDASHVNWT